MIGFLIPLNLMDLPVYTRIVELVSCATKIYSISGMILFCLCGWIASELFQLLLDELNDKKSCINLCVKLLKKRYEIICRFTDDINHCFGWVMLIFITYTMASASMVCFVAAVEFQYHDRTSLPWVYVRDLVILIQHAIHLAIITSISQSIKNKVI